MQAAGAAARALLRKVQAINIEKRGKACEREGRKKYLNLLAAALEKFSRLPEMHLQAVHSGTRLFRKGDTRYVFLFRSEVQFKVL